MTSVRSFRLPLSPNSRKTYALKQFGRSLKQLDVSSINTNKHPIETPLFHTSLIKISSNYVDKNNDIEIIIGTLLSVVIIWLLIEMV